MGGSGSLYPLSPARDERDVCSLPMKLVDEREAEPRRAAGNRNPQTCEQRHTASIYK